MQYEEIMQRLRSLSNLKAVAGMNKFGINTQKTYGVSIPNLRILAREVRESHALSQQLWSSEIHEARILASMIDDPKQVTEDQMDNWVNDFDSWDVCDQCCNNLFRKTKFAYQKCFDWSSRKQEFVKRAGFALMACLAIGDKKANNGNFVKFFPIITKESIDDRNFVKKAINWALRQIGKRNIELNKKAIEIAKEIQRIDSKSAQWIASDAIRELTSERVQKKLLLTH